MCPVWSSELVTSLFIDAWSAAARSNDPIGPHRLASCELADLEINYCWQYHYSNNIIMFPSDTAVKAHIVARYAAYVLEDQ